MRALRCFYESFKVLSVLTCRRAQTTPSQPNTLPPHTLPPQPHTLPPPPRTLPPATAAAVGAAHRRPLPDRYSCTFHTKPQEGEEGESVISVAHTPFVIGRGRGSDWFIPGPRCSHFVGLWG